MVEQLSSEYASAGKPVVFIEDHVITPVGGRKSYWQAAFPGGTAYYPLSMVDSGHTITNGYTYGVTYQTYKDMVDASLARPAQAGFDLLNSARVSNHLHFAGRVTNWMPTNLPATANVHIIIYEVHTPVANEHVTQRILRAHVYQSIGVSLPTNASATFSLDTAELSNIVDWSKVRAVALIDYRPGGTTGAYDMLQATMIFPLTTLYLPVLHR